MNEVMIYMTFLVITNVIAIMLLHHSIMQSLHVGMRIRIVCSSLLYRKVIMRTSEQSWEHYLKKIMRYRYSSYFLLKKVTCQQLFILKSYILPLLEKVTNRYFSVNVEFSFVTYNIDKINFIRRVFAQQPNLA